MNFDECVQTVVSDWLPKKVRWKDTLPDIDSTDLAYAAFYLTRASTNPGSGISNDFLLIAGKIIRNHRKSLGVKSYREPDMPLSVPDFQLITRAMLALSRILDTDEYNPDYEAEECRIIEASLRTHFHRNQP